VTPRWYRCLFGVSFLLVCYGLVGLVAGAALGGPDPVVSLNLLVLGVLLSVYFYLRGRQARPPMPPQNVRLHLPDGTTVPVECAYDGKEGDQHVWTMVLPEAIYLDILDGWLPVRLSADVFPAKTTIRFPVIPR
jgi:hypothetical protein